jgi:hypothetical protein
MARILPAILLVVLTVYCLVECAQSDRDSVRNLPKALWLALVLLLPLVGPLGWLFLGRPRVAAQTSRDRHPAAQIRRNPIAPDDDPRFLAQLDQVNRDLRRFAEWDGEPPDTTDPDDDGKPPRV